MDGIIDIHCHFLPYVDDGAESYKMARQMLRRHYQDGVRKMILTPHYRQGMFEATDEEIRWRFQKMQSMITKMKMDMELYLGCEFHSKENMVESIKNHPQRRMAGTPYILVEFSSRHNFRLIQNQIFELTAAGYKPIIAHIERYDCMHDNRNIEELLDHGAQMQINAESILGDFGWRVKRQCMQWIKNDYICYIGSDAHNVDDRKPNLGPCAQYLEKKIGHEYTKELLIENPGKIINQLGRN